MRLDVERRQRQLHRAEQGRYNLTHPVHGTISGDRARELWAGRNCLDNQVHPTPEEDEIIMFLWLQMSGSSNYMGAFFIFLNQD